MRGDKECPYSGVTKSGRIWLLEMPESDAQNVAAEDAGKRCSEYAFSAGFLTVFVQPHLAYVYDLKQNETQSARAESTHKGVN